MINIPRRTRSDRWAGLSDPQFRSNVADDLDENERDHAEIMGALQTTNRLLMGLLVTITAASIVGALNLIYAI